MLREMEPIEICSKQCKSKCCKSTPPALTNSDFERINKLQENKNWFNNIDQGENTTIVIAKREDSNNCYFLSEEGLCDIYSSRPLDCKLFPLFFKINKINESEYNLRWLVWYCPLTDAKTLDVLKEEAKTKIEIILSENPDQLFEYQNAMYASQGYKKKHFLYEERLKIKRSGE